MTKTRSPDYDKRREAILSHASRLYAKHGFLGASTADLAKACKVSKSLIYHYYPSKAEILYGVMSSHLEDLHVISEGMMKTRDLAADERLRQITLKFMQAYVEAAASHKVLLNELDNLPAHKRKAIVSRQREIISTVETLLVGIRPDIAGNDLKRPISMLFFGMINWTHTWYSSKGPIAPQTLANVAFDILVNGLREIDIDAHAS